MIFNFQFSEKDGSLQKFAKRDQVLYCNGLVHFLTIVLHYNTITELNVKIIQCLNVSLHYARPMPGRWVGYLYCIPCSHNVLFIHRLLFAENWTNSSMLLLHTCALYLCLPSRVTSHHNSPCICLFILRISTDFVILIL